eukprot:TRINITY_DN9946_c0_g1_i1.p1 TRINITY_DN9946_c0_g1~~TRINITY_DN9946_c0_g1_i1.p1  ORF type:complete len:231 (+),score=26.31 TRINITY_DN9946_c0_g1_i1:320-1012(+)
MFSKEQRYHALGLHDEGYLLDDVAQIMRCSVTSLRRWMRSVGSDGTVWSNAVLRNTHQDAAVRNDDLNNTILKLLDAEPAAFLWEHVDLLVRLTEHHPEVDHRYLSASTVHRILRANNYTRKRIERLYEESSDEAQRQFVMATVEVPMRFLVSVDETYTDVGNVPRRFGRSPEGVPCELLERDARSFLKTSTMMGVSMTMGVVWSQTVVLGPAQTSDNWRLFFQCLKAQM